MRKACLVVAAFGTGAHGVAVCHGPGPSLAVSSRVLGFRSAVHMFSAEPPVATEPVAAEPMVKSLEGQGDDWQNWLQRARYARLREIALSISVRRTVEEAELAVKLAQEYSSDATLLQVPSA